MVEYTSVSNNIVVSMMSPTNEFQQSRELVHVEAALETHNIPMKQPTTSLILSHIGFPRLSSMAKWIRKGNGKILLAIRIILATLSVIIFFIATQQGYTGVTLSGNPWLPLTEVIGSPLDLLTVLLNSYILIPTNLILGQLILLYLDLPICWLLKNDRHRLWFWVIISTFVWFIVALAIGLFIEGAITWGLVLFPEGASQMLVVLLGGVFFSGMIELVFLFALTREIIRISRPKFIQIEGRFMAVRDYVTNRRYMKRPFSAISEQPSTSINHSIFIRESWMNWIRVLILIGFGIGIEFVLPEFGALSLTPLAGSVFLTLVGLVVLGLALYSIINGLKRGLRTYWSAFLSMTFVIIVEGMFLSLFCGFVFALASTIAGLLVLVILNLKIRQLIDENPGILNPIYFRYLLAGMSSDEVHAFIEDTLDHLSEALPQQV
jgi:hypothetical protein